MTGPETPNGTTERSAILADAEHSRRLAIEALENGRLEMGVAFATLALRAQRAGRAIPYRLVEDQAAGPRTVAVPLLGATRDEQPRASSPTHWAEAHAAGLHASMWVEKCETCQGQTGDLLAAEATSIFNGVNTASMPLPRSSRCQVRDVTPCWGPVYLEAVTGVWRHLNPQLDAQHTPIPREEDR